MINPEDCGLLIVDIQGKLANIVCDSEQVISNTAKLIKCCQILSIPVVLLEQNPGGLGPTTDKILECIKSPEYFEKYTFNGLGEPAIKAYVKNANKTHWLVAGIEAHICVYQTAKGLIGEGFNVEVVSDCISSRQKSNLDLAINNLREAGANITSLEMCIYDLLQSSRSEHFKAVLNIVK